MARQYEMLSFGVFLIIAAVLMVLFAGGGIKRFDEAVAIIIALYGVWTMILAGIRVRNPEKYGRGAYSTLVMGVVLTALGGAWVFYIEGANIIVTIALILVVIGILAVATAIPSFRQKPEPQQQSTQEQTS
jgi:ribose/xylose/arabinose/galactoside ABC-type transport system permease subunit